MSQSPEDQAIRFSGSPGLHLPRAVVALGAVAKAAPLIGDHARPAGAPVRIWAMRVRRAPHFGAKPLSIRSDARAPSGRQSIDRPLPVLVGRFDRDVEMTVKTISEWCGTNSKKNRASEITARCRAASRASSFARTDLAGRACWLREYRGATPCLKANWAHTSVQRLRWQSCWSRTNASCAEPESQRKVTSQSARRLSV